jgi:hypothetical protein
MRFWICIHVIVLLGFALIPIAARAAAFGEGVTVQAESPEIDVANAAEIDGAAGGDGEDYSHAIFVWSIVLGCIAGGLSIVGLVLWLVFRYEKKRTAALEIVANEIDLQFSPHKDERLLAKLQQFRLFNWGHSRRMKNVMTAVTEHATMTIFDYQFTTGGGNHSRTHSHTLVAMEMTALQLPRFSIWPEGWTDKIEAKLGFQDIDFDQHPEFSSKFVLQADDETAVRCFLTNQILDMFVTRPEISVDAIPGLFTYMKARRSKPEEIRELMAEAYAFAKVFQENPARK